MIVMPMKKFEEILIRLAIYKIGAMVFDNNKRILKSEIDYVK
jgi:hypothetical protein